MQTPKNAPLNPPLSDADPCPDPLNALSLIHEICHGDITEGEEGGGTSGLSNEERRRGERLKAKPRLPIPHRR